MNQYALGWSEVWDRHIENSTTIESAVRITARHKHSYEAIAVTGARLNCYPAGRLMHDAASQAALPAVGDWCLIGERFLDESNQPAAVIQEVLPRRSKLSRMGAGVEIDEQVLAANVDLVFIVASASNECNLNRISRFVLLARYGGTEPVIVISKVDCWDDEDWERRRLACTDWLEPLQQRFPDIPVIQTSSVTSTGLDELRERLLPGVTAVFVGPSGVGKSTLVNALIGTQEQRTAAVRVGDDKGRHTTSSAGLFFLPDGGMIIDTPGLREVQVIAGDDDLDQLLPDVSHFAAACKFRDCSHSNEPGCQVLNALVEGTLAEAEYANYEKLEREAAYSRRKLDQRLAAEERKRWKRITLDNRRRTKARG